MMPPWLIRGSHIRGGLAQTPFLEMRSYHWLGVLYALVSALAFTSR